MKRQLLVLGAVFFFCAGVAAWGWQVGSGEEKALDESFAKWVTAFDKHDAQALAKQYTEDADVLSTTGEMIKGRTAIEKDFAAYFARNPNVKGKLQVVARRLLAPHIVVEDGKWEVLGETDDGPKQGLYTGILVKKNGIWLTVCERNIVPVKSP